MKSRFLSMRISKHFVDKVLLQLILHIIEILRQHIEFLFLEIEVSLSFAEQMRNNLLRDIK